MRLLRFRAATTAQAIASIRAALGEEALILSTRRTGGEVEITAGIEAAPPAEPEPVQPRAARTPAPAPEHSPPAAAPLDGADRAAAFAFHGVPAALAARLAAGPLPFALAAALRFTPFPAGLDGAVILFAGPPGAGKTLTLVRLAARLVLAGVRPVVVTTDTQRAGAVEQLAAFTGLLGLELRDAGGPGGLARAVAPRPVQAPLLIDTAGMDCLDPAALADLRRLAGLAGAETVGVLAAGGDAGETADLARGLAAVGARRLVITRLDLTRRLGGVLAAGAVLGLAEFGVGAGAADGLAPASAADLARRLRARLPAAIREQTP